MNGAIPLLRNTPYLYAFLMSPIRPTCLVHFILLDLISPFIIGEV
jgi:hypothetical protein